MSTGKEVGGVIVVLNKHLSNKQMPEKNLNQRNIFQIEKKIMSTCFAIWFLL